LTATAIPADAKPTVIATGRMQMKIEKNDKRRILGRRVARELTPKELKAVGGGTTSCSDCRADDCDQAY
jgi:hypothetical protein